MLAILMRRLGLAALAVSLTGCTGSSDDSDSTATVDNGRGGVSIIGGNAVTYSLCSTSLSKSEFLRLMNGNLVFVMQASDKGASASEAIAGLVTMLVVNGLDTEKLASYDLAFSDGDYTFTSGDEGYTFTLYFAEDFGDYAAGDKIPYNVFDYNSYLSNLNVQLLPTPSVTYDEGPLFDLIDGSIDLDGASLSSLDVKFQLHAELISFSLNTANTYNGSAPREDDTLLFMMTSTPAALPSIKEQFDAGGFGLLFDGTVYTSQYYDVVQTYGSSPALLKHDDTGYFWRLEYESAVDKSDLKLYQTGLASQRESNTTSYFCDAAHADRIGIATHADDLRSGSFVFEDGTTISYGLEDF